MAEAGPAKPQTLPKNFSDGNAKLFLINRALRARKARSEVFLEGEYIPLAVKGAFANHVVGFCRNKAEPWVLVVAPRFLATVTGAWRVYLWAKFGKTPHFAFRTIAQKMDGNFVRKHGFLDANRRKQRAPLG